MDRLEPTWRTVLPDVLATAAGLRGVVVDLRSPVYQATGLPSDLGDRTVTLRVEQNRAFEGRIGDVVYSASAARRRGTCSDRAQIRTTQSGRRRARRARPCASSPP
jgi:hypothetical protein